MASKQKQRLLSLDILRGITVAGMILVNNGYWQSFEMLRHSEWNGMTPCDLVFPFFLFIVGVSTFLSLSKYQFQPSKAVITKILRRTIILFVIGLAIHWFDHAVDGDFWCFDHLRIWAVLQRIALCYGIVSLFVIFVPHRWVLPTAVALLAIYTLILLLGNGYAQDASNILVKVDVSLFGEKHLYQHSPVDPEGLLGTISSVAHVLIGFYCGMAMKKAETISKKIICFFFVGTILLLCGYLLSYGLPINKTIWSPSYVLVTCGLAALLQGALMVVVDMWGKRRWCAPFKVFGVNPLFLYVSSEVLAIALGKLGVSQTVFEGIHAVIPAVKWASLVYALFFVALNFLLGGVLYKRNIYIKL